MGNQTQCEAAGWERIDWSKASGPSMAGWMFEGSAVASSIEEGPACAVEAVWRARQMGLLDFVCAALAVLRDAGYAKVELAVVFKALELDSISRMAKIEWLGQEISDLAKRYAESLPGYDGALGAQEQAAAASEAHDFLRFSIELPLRKALGLGFCDHPPIAWDRIPSTRLEKLAIEESIELQACLERKPKRTRRRL